MNKHVSDMEVPFKAPVSEIFAALSGVTCAAIAIVRGTTGLTKEDALGDAGYQAASKSYDIKAALIHKKDAVTQEFLAKDALQFLDASASVLCWYPDVRLMTPKGTRGKSTKELLAHIENMLEREKSDGPRIIEKFNETGDVKTPFQAAYLPKVGKRDAEKSYEGEEEEPSETPKRGRKKRGYAWTSNKPVLV